MRTFLWLMGVWLVIQACHKDSFTSDELLKEAEEQLAPLRDSALYLQALPRSVKNNNAAISWIKGSMDWTEGFFPGSCWLIYKYSGENEWKDAAIRLQDQFADHRYDSSTHDLGFIFNCSFGNAYRLTGDETYAEILRDAANSLITRYDSTIGCIKSWDWAPERWNFPVIIDNMMNLELLFEVAKHTGDSTYYRIAKTHAITTLKNHYRDDYSSFHVVDYDSTGKIIRKMTHQGYSDSSSWARGQVWGLYGFTICYRYTRDTIFLNQAVHIADYLMSRLPEDTIFPWDLDAPDSLLHYKDASASAIFASALLELDRYGQKGYTEEAYNVLRILGSSDYMATGGGNCHFLLKHSVGSLPEDSEVDVPLVYADYYFLEALLRLNNGLTFSH